MQAATKQLLREAPSTLRKLQPPSQLPRPRATTKIEEESWPWYHPGLFYPAHIGEVLHSRYRILSKLGYGSRSTAWLCRDLAQHRYVTVKVCERSRRAKSREARAYVHLSTTIANSRDSSAASGSRSVRGMLDSFTLAGPVGQHHCFVHEPLSVSLGDVQCALPDRRLPARLVKRALLSTLRGLDFLHREAGMVHTDIQPWNVMHRPASDSVFAALEFAETSLPTPRHLDAGGHAVHSSCALASVVDADRLEALGAPVLCDLGQARFGRRSYTAEIQPDVYRAPEVILEVPWDAKADIWNVGVMAWDLYAAQQLFDGRDEAGQVSLERQLEQMVGVMGPPPTGLLERSRGLRADELFDTDGKLRSREARPARAVHGNEEGSEEQQHHHHHHHHRDDHRLSLQQHQQQQQQRDDVKLADADEGFVRLVARMLRWVPEERPTAEELLKDEWLLQGSVD